MNGTDSFTKGLSEVNSLWADGNDALALKRLAAMEKIWSGNAHLQILLSQIVQLSDEPTHTLEDAKRALKRAVELDKFSPAAAIELGHFLDNIEDDPQAASKSFAQGIAAARHSLIDGLLGQAKSLLQLEKREDALRCLVEAFRLADDDRSSNKGYFTSRIEELFQELGQMQSA